MKCNLLLLLIFTMMVVYSHQKQKYRLNINNNLDHHFLEIALFARAGNERASRIVYMQPHTQRLLELPFCCAEIKAHAWLSAQKASKVLDPRDIISVCINKNNEGNFVITNN